jgi:hypothetical protein
MKYFFITSLCVFAVQSEARIVTPNPIEGKIDGLAGEPDAIGDDLTGLPAPTDALDEAVRTDPDVQKMIDGALVIRYGSQALKGKDTLPWKTWVATLPPSRPLALRGRQALDGHVAAITGRIRKIARDRKELVSIKEAVRRAENLLRLYGIGLDWYQR